MKISLLAVSLLALLLSIPSPAESLKKKRFLLDYLTPQYIVGECIKCHCSDACLGEGGFAVTEKAVCEPFHSVIECSNQISGNTCPHGQCSGHSDCIQVDGVGRACLCLSGYTGRHCDVPVNTATQTTVPPSPTPAPTTTTPAPTTTTTTTQTTTTTPTPVHDFCSGYPCGIHGQCNNDVNGYTCTCNPGWIGQNCQTDVGPCKSSPCQNGGTCLDMGSSFLCLCADSWAGTMCDKDATPSCGHRCVLESVAYLTSVTNNASRICHDNTKTSNEAIPMTCCGLGKENTWIRGMQVMGHCSTVPVYTPIAKFINGRPVNDTAGVLIQCDDNELKYIRQVCDNKPDIIIVDGTHGLNPSSFFAIY